MQAGVSRVRVLVMDQDEDLRHWLGRLLDRTEGFENVGYCADSSELAAMSQRLEPHLILLDTHSAAQLAPGTLGRLRKSLPGLYVVLMDLEEGPAYDRLAKRAGADGFLCKARVPEALERLRSLLQDRLKHSEVA
ncbi:MAG: response regulator [Desulfarculus sp.]|nr:response regulator [Desulfarculus sp.]